MKLKAYRLSIDKSVKDAAAELDVSEPGYRYWEAGKKTPSDDNMVEIFIWSLGHVTPNDFYNLPTLKNTSGSFGGAGVQGSAKFDPLETLPRPPSCQSALRNRDDASSFEVLPGQIDMFSNQSSNKISNSRGATS